MNYLSQRQRQPWRDVMQVCLNGHVINDSYQKYPNSNKDYCDKCGEKTIISCPSCNQPIPGDLQDTGVVAIGFEKSAPDFCQSCGEKFPWQKKTKNTTGKGHEDYLLSLKNIFAKFHRVVRQLRVRHGSRNTLDVTDEYDVQDLLHSLLHIFFDDIRPEEVVPSYAGKSSRVDFLLKKERIVVEVKMTRKGLADREIGDQLIIDVARYKEHQDCSTLVCFIYDPEGRVTNPNGLISDLQKQSGGDLEVIVYITPE